MKFSESSGTGRSSRGRGLKCCGRSEDAAAYSKFGSIGGGSSP